MQRIIVKNFGPLKDIDLEIKDYMVFLGPQASGKSTLAKLIYGFQDVIWKGFYYGGENIFWNYKTIDNKLSLRFLINEWESYFRNYFFPILQRYNKYEITFIYCDFVSVNLTETNGLINVKFNDSFSKTLLEIAQEIENNNLILSKLSKQFINSDVREHIRILFPIKNNAIYIPDKRDIESNDPHSGYYNIINFYRTAYFQEGFKSLKNGIKNTAGDFNERTFNILKKYFQTIFKGEFENINSGQISLSNGEKVSLDLASSGQKEVIGILLILSVEIFNKSRDFYVIEEPEAHLFPEAQKDITYLISLLANQEGNQVIITTHSHYILGALNILINAHRIGRTNPEAVEKIIPRELWVDKNRVFAGFLENGEIKNIYDNEAEMIKIQQLNAVAGEINKDFDKLLDLEFANEEIN